MTFQHMVYSTRSNRFLRLRLIFLYWVNAGDIAGPPTGCATEARDSQEESAWWPAIRPLLAKSAATPSPLRRESRSSTPGRALLTSRLGARTADNDVDHPMAVAIQATPVVVRIVPDIRPGMGTPAAVDVARCSRRHVRTVAKKLRCRSSRVATSPSIVLTALKPGAVRRRGVAGGPATKRPN